MYKNHGMSIAIAKSNNDTSMIDPILIDYKVIQLYFNIKLNKCDYKNLLLPHPLSE